MARSALTVRCAVVGCQLLLACSGPAPGPAPKSPGAHELIVEGVTAERWIDGRLRASARARRGTLDRRAGLITADELSLVARDTSGEESGHLRATRASADVRGERGRLEGEVAITDRFGRTATATAADYRGDTELITIPGPVEMRGGNFVARGRSMVMSMNAETATIAGPIHATVDQSSPR